MTKRIAMWSGPRNLSTAMMYSFAQRSDARVVDEPFYAAYLNITGLEHPMRDDVLASQPQDPDAVAASLVSESDAPVYYQKHMCQHMIDGIPRDWMGEVTNVFLLRHPARVVASFAKGYPALTVHDIGFALQAELFDHCLALGARPVVVDSADIREDPEGMLGKLCDAIGIPFDPAMLRWAAGGNPADGVWAPVWYGSLHQSTGFAGPEGPLPDLSGRHAEIADAALRHYTRLSEHKLT